MAEKFDNPRQVHKHLEEIGVNVSLRSVYNHVKSGRLQKGGDGCFSAAAVEKYTKALQSETNASSADPTTLSEKHEADTRKAAAQARHWEIKTKILEGKYVEREWAERQLAARALVLKSDMENFFRSRAPAIVAKSDGNVDLVPDVIEYLLGEFEKIVGRYSEPIEFEVPDGGA